MQKLPARNYRWLTPTEIDALDITKVSDVGRKGYALEVDLHYPRKLREEHSDLPLAPEHYDVFYNDLSA